MVLQFNDFGFRVFWPRAWVCWTSYWCGSAPLNEAIVVPYWDHFLYVLGEGHVMLKGGDHVI